MNKLFIAFSGMGLCLVLLGAGCSKASPTTNTPPLTSESVSQPLQSPQTVTVPYPTEAPSTQSTQTGGSGGTGGSGTATKPASSPSPVVAAMTYTQALNVYKKTGAYIQFARCHGNPGYISMKKGTKFMLDNRDKATHTIGVGKIASYKVGGYGFAVVSAPGAGQYYLTCDGGGAALLNVES